MGLPLGSAITALATLLTVGLTLFFTNRNQAQRLEHERLMRLREERLKAYTTLARITKLVEPTEPYQKKDLVEVVSEIEVLSNHPELEEEAKLLMAAAIKWRKEASDRFIQGAKNPLSHPWAKQAKDETERHRIAFVRLAREELQVSDLRRSW